MYIMDTILKDLTNIINSIVIKYDKKAKAGDTLEITKASDLYISAVSLQDSFNTYQSFDEQAIINAGITDMTKVAAYVLDKTTIPLDKRNAVVAAQRALIISNYVEQNNYYRTLNGLPDYGDNNYIYLPQDVCYLYSIDPTKPIHELSDEELTRLTGAGILDQIKAAYPTKTYLNFIGSDRISIYAARTTNNFGILKMTKIMSQSFYEEFNSIYNQCREYFMSVIYLKDYSSKYDLYDNFIALMIMVMTIQRLITNTFKYGIERDFYDLGSIKAMFDAYNVPFFNEIDVEHQRILLHNLNHLLRYKSTDKVLYDICSLLGYDRIKIYKYYLMKKHKMDNNGMPLFVYKNVYDYFGNVIGQTFDNEQMFDIFFQAVELREPNVALALSNELNRIPYDQVVLEDPYWWDDDDLKRQMYDSEYNFIETKYLNMNIMYKLTQMLFEVEYIFRLIMDNKDLETSFEIQLPRIFEDKKKDIFNVVIFMCAMLAKKNGLRGEIISSASKTLAIMGFNFSQNLAAIRQYVLDNAKYIDPVVLNYIGNMDITKPSDINKLYTNIKGFNDFIVERMARSQTLEEYRAYQYLFKTLMITQDTATLYRKSDGNIAETFLDYLLDKDIDMYNFVINTTADKMSEYIDHVLARINLFAANLQYLYILNDSNNVLINAIIALTRFFKSYTTDLSTFNILYQLDSRYFNMIKMMGKIKGTTKEIGINDTANGGYQDIMHNIGATIRDKDKSLTTNMHDVIKSIAFDA